MQVWYLICLCALKMNKESKQEFYHIQITYNFSQMQDWLDVS